LTSAVAALIAVAVAAALAIPSTISFNFGCFGLAVFEADLARLVVNGKHSHEIDPFKILNNVD
jgi:hypothetical protein